jgi:FHS family Na+ dependent glucose MFS transporter 1
MNSRNQRACLAIYYGISAAVGLMAGVLGPVLPQLAGNAHTTLQGVSLVLAMRPAGYMAGTQISGRGLDRMPGHPVLMLGLLLAALSLALVPRMGALGGLALLIFAFGLADGMLDVGVNTLLPWAFGDKAGPYFNGLHFAFGVGALCAPLMVAKSMALGGGMAWAFWGMALAMLPLAAALQFTASPRHKAPAAETKAGPLDRRALAGLLFVFMMYGGSETGFAAWIFSYAWKSGLAGELQSNYLTSLFWASLTLGRLLGIGIALRVSLEKIMAVDAAGCALCLGAMLLWPASRPALWMGSLGLGLCMASFFPSLVAYAGRRLSPGGHVSGRLTSLFFVASSTGSMLIPWLIGQGFERLGPLCSVAVLFLAVLLMGLTLIPLLRGHFLTMRAGFASPPEK